MSSLASGELRKIRVRDKGNITIPIKFRKVLNIEEDDILEVSVIGKAIVLTKKDNAIKQDNEIINRFIDSFKEEALYEK